MIRFCLGFQIFNLKGGGTGMKRKLVEIEEDLDKCMSRLIALLGERGILRKEMLSVLRGTQLYCPDCGRKSTLSKWVFIQIYYHDPPLGDIEGDWQKRPPSQCGLRCPKCNPGIFHIPKLALRNKLLKIIEKVGHSQHTELFRCVEEMEEDDLLTQCK